MLDQLRQSPPEGGSALTSSEPRPGQIDPAFWKGKRVLVTGHTGFKGSWLSLWLQRLGAEVVGLALPPSTEPSMFEVTQVAAGMTSIEADVRNLDDLRRAFAKHRPEIVIHLAAQALVKRSYDEPVLTYATNVLGTLHVLDAARSAPGLRVVACITSDKCYENSEWVWGYRENDRLGGRDPYSSSKACAEHVISSYRSSYFPQDGLSNHGVAVASMRAGNVIGGGDWSKDRLIPDIIRAVLAKQRIEIRNPNSTRPWQFVLEPLSGYLLLAERMWDDGPGFSESWNFGPNTDQIQPVAWIVRRVLQLCDQDGACDLDTFTHAHEDNLLKLDCSKANTRLKWQPRLDLHEALEWIVEWWQAHSHKQNMRRVTEDQIARYEALMLAR